MKKIIFAIVLLSSFALAIEKVFSLTSPKKEWDEKEIPLLLSEPDGTLPAADAQKVIRNLQVVIAKPHKVGRNEWLEKIAEQYGTQRIYLRSTNRLEDPFLRPNQEILVQNKKGMIHIATKEEPLDSVIAGYQKLGGKRETILAMNSLDELTLLKDGRLYLKEGSKLWIPDAKMSFPAFSRPVFWSRISSWFGRRRHPVSKQIRYHNGFDMAAPHGSPVYAGESGEVTAAEWRGGYGNVIEIRHSKTTTLYGHLSKIYVQVGQKVKRKQIVGRVGSTGISTGPHLHFEVRRNSDGKALNPRRYLY